MYTVSVNEVHLYLVSLLTLPTESVFGVRMLYVLTDSAMAATVALLVIK